VKASPSLGCKFGEPASRLIAYFRQVIFIPASRCMALRSPALVSHGDVVYTQIVTDWIFYVLVFGASVALVGLVAALLF
jgi:hypothetical protein